jgi:hypothetical protein
VPPQSPSAGDDHPDDGQSSGISPQTQKRAETEKMAPKDITATTNVTAVRHFSGGKDMGGGRRGGGSNCVELNTIAARSGFTLRYETEQSGSPFAPTWAAKVYGECCHYMCNEYKTFRNVLVNEVVYGTGTGRSKGDAKEAAAHVAIDYIYDR